VDTIHVNHRGKGSWIQIGAQLSAAGNAHSLGLRVSWLENANGYTGYVHSRLKGKLFNYIKDF
jgi:hypothetical protein